jgi:hypothetical protein
MNSHVLVWDLETVPDLAAVARVNGLDGENETEVRAALGDKFPKLVFHRIACIGALTADTAGGAGRSGRWVRPIARSGTRRGSSNLSWTRSRLCARN